MGGEDVNGGGVREDLRGLHLRLGQRPILPEVQVEEPPEAVATPQWDHDDPADTEPKGLGGEAGPASGVDLEIDLDGVTTPERHRAGSLLQRRLQPLQCRRVHVGGPQDPGRAVPHLRHPGAVHRDQRSDGVEEPGGDVVGVEVGEQYPRQFRQQAHERVTIGQLLSFRIRA